MISETKINESFQISQFLIDGLMGGDKLQCLFKKCLNDFNTDDITVDRGGGGGGGGLAQNGKTRNSKLYNLRVIEY